MRDIATKAKLARHSARPNAAGGCAMSTDPISTAPRPSLTSSEGWSIRRVVSADWTSAVLALLFVLAVVGFFHPNFLAPGQLINVVQSAVYAALIAAGLVFLIPQNEIDLSVGGTYILTGIVAALLMRAGLNPSLAILLSLLVAILVGLLNAATSQVIGIPSLIGTLAMNWMLRGLALALANGTQVTGVPLDDPLIAILGGGRILGLPASVVLLIVVGIGLSVLMHKTPFGYRVRQIGSNPDVAAFSGIPIRQTETLGRCGGDRGAGLLYCGRSAKRRRHRIVRGCGGRHRRHATGGRQGHGVRRDHWRNLVDRRGRGPRVFPDPGHLGAVRDRSGDPWRGFRRRAGSTTTAQRQAAQLIPQISTLPQGFRATAANL